MTTTRVPANIVHVPTPKKLLTDDGQIHPVWAQMLTNQASLLNQGVPAATNVNNKVQRAQSQVIPLAKITVGGAAGSITITGGIVTAFILPT